MQLFRNFLKNMEDTNPQDNQTPQETQNTNPAPTGGQPQGDQAAQGDQSAQGAQPAGGQPQGDQAAKGKKDLSGIMEENVDISSLVSNAGNKADQDKFLAEAKIPDHPNTKFDEQKFLNLLATSISLTFNEKKNIITAITQLSQFQIDELMKIFEEEQKKFTELEKKHAEQMADLEKTHSGSAEAQKDKAAEETKQSAEAQEAEDIKKQLGL